jgi:hypothetical protein
LPASRQLLPAAAAAPLAVSALPDAGSLHCNMMHWLRG